MHSVSGEQKRRQVRVQALMARNDILNWEALKWLNYHLQREPTMLGISANGANQFAQTNGTI
jgi:hypothetical protein